MHTTTNFFRFAVVLLTFGVLAPLATAAGLLAPNDQSLPPLRITDHLVEASVNNHLALTTVKQTFHNDTNQRLEATYVFPLPENADLTGFQMSFNGKMVEGEVLPADQARDVYERIVRYPAGELDPLELAYACSIHKSQGSEYPCVVVVLHTQHYVMLQRNLLYTALTRGKRLVVLLGNRRAVARAVRNAEARLRYTRLAERLRGP